jgi:hypothetical protein
MSFLTFLAPKRVRDSELAFQKGGEHGTYLVPVRALVVHPDSIPPDQWMKESTHGSTENTKSSAKVSTSKIIQKCQALSEYLETNDTKAILHSLPNVLGG